MGYKLCSNIICPNPTEGAAKNIRSSHALKTINIFESPDNKNIRKSKQDLPFLFQKRRYFKHVYGMKIFYCHRYIVSGRYTP